MVTIIWDVFLLEAESQRNEGINIIRKIWNDMKSHHGYLKHDILIDDDNSSHIAIVSDWVNRELADKSVKEYADSEPVKLLAPLLAGPRQRTVFRSDNRNG